MKHHGSLFLFSSTWFLVGWFIADFISPVPGQSCRRVAQYADGSTLFYCQPRGGWCREQDRGLGRLRHRNHCRDTRRASAFASG